MISTLIDMMKNELIKNGCLLHESRNVPNTYKHKTSCDFQWLDTLFCPKHINHKFLLKLISGFIRFFINE